MSAPSQYHPTLIDVAKLLASTGGIGPNPEAGTLLHWLIDQIPEMRELWRAANEVQHQGVTLLDLVRLQHCLVDELVSDEAYGAAAWLLRQVPCTNELMHQLEQMGRDAGQIQQYPRFAIDVVRQHAQVDRLLDDTSWASAEAALDLSGTGGVDYEELIRIVDARMARNDGDQAKLTALRAALRCEARLSAMRPLLETQLDRCSHLFQILELIERSAQHMGSPAKSPPAAPPEEE